MNDADDRPTTPLTAEPGLETEPTPLAEVPARTTSVQALPVTADSDPAPRYRGPRMRTLVLALVLLAVSATSLVRLLTDRSVDEGVVALVVLIVAGALLLAGGVVSAARDARDAAGRS